jgi:hypothetical protein
MFTVHMCERTSFSMSYIQILFSREFLVQQ